VGQPSDVRREAIDDCRADDHCGDGRLTDDARAALVAEFSEYDVRPYDDSTLEQFIDDDAAIWIVGATCWWLWADTTAALARIAGLARAHGELGAFVADTRDARTVLADLG
jgi:hypothetical protein